jgi:ABC-type transport system involved in Fe-S cluster assembly fused permease/ATPase subunit
MMTLYLNAWLDCAHPKMTINNRNTNEVLANFNALEIEELFASGEITLDELNSNDPTIQQELIKTLFLSRIMINFKQQLHDMGKGLKQRTREMPLSERRSFPPLIPVSSSRPFLESFALHEPIIIKH